MMEMHECRLCGSSSTGHGCLDKTLCPECDELRNDAAIAAIQGLTVGCSGLLNGQFTAYAKGSCNAAIAERAVLLANYLLAELAKPKEATNV